MAPLGVEPGHIAGQREEPGVHQGASGGKREGKREGKRKGKRKGKREGKREGKGYYYNAGDKTVHLSK